MEGMLATSMSGHDKGKLYVIFREDQEYVYLVDGTIRTTEKPKKKNKKHIQIIKKLRTETQGQPLNDLEIKRMIKMYQKQHE